MLYFASCISAFFLNIDGQVDTHWSPYAGIIIHGEVYFYTEMQFPIKIQCINILQSIKVSVGINVTLVKFG